MSSQKKRRQSPTLSKLDKKQQAIEFKERLRREEETAEGQKSERMLTFSLIPEKTKRKSKSFVAIGSRTHDEVEGNSIITKKKQGMVTKNLYTHQNQGGPIQSFNTNYTTKTTFHPRTASMSNISLTQAKQPKKEKKEGVSFILGSRNTGHILSKTRNRKASSQGIDDSSATTLTVTPRTGLKNSRSKDLLINQEISEYISSFSAKKSTILVQKKPDFFLNE